VILATGILSTVSTAGKLGPVIPSPPYKGSGLELGLGLAIYTMVEFELGLESGLGLR
jgi:hypothetical protein